MQNTAHGCRIIDWSADVCSSDLRPSGMQHKVPGSNLGVMLAGSPIRLAVLNSCHGGAVLAQDPYGSSAIALVEQGIPAVIAMQFQISYSEHRRVGKGVGSE